MPIFAVVADFLVDGDQTTQRGLTFAACFPTEQWVEGTVSELPITDRCCCNVNDEGYTCGEGAYDCRGNPSRGRVEHCEETIFDGLPAVDESVSVGVFDLE